MATTQSTCKTATGALRSATNCAPCGLEPVQAEREARPTGSNTRFMTVSFSLSISYIDILDSYDARLVDHPHLLVQLHMNIFSVGFPSGMHPLQQ